MTQPDCELRNSDSGLRNRFACYLVRTAFCLLLFALCSLPFATAHAQSATATLSGTVEDQNGAIVPGVEITVMNPATALERQVTTNDAGYFTVPLLPPGTYVITAKRQGFMAAEIRDVVLNVGDQKGFQIQLKTGNINETVNVTAETPLINESPAVGTVVDRHFVENMPLNGRSFQALITLTPGVVLTKANVGEAGQFSVNGQRADANYFTVDGVSANVGINAGGVPTQSFAGALPGLSASGGTNSLVSVDAMQEFRVQTSTYAPEFGRSPGAQVQIVTRSGANAFHATLFDYLRNDVFDANNWFANANRQAKPPLRQNDFGGVFSGPLFLPRLGEGGRAFKSGRNRTFFFFSYEGLRLLQPLTAVTEVPSLASRQTAQTTVPQIVPFLNMFPVPNGPIAANGSAQFSASFSNPSTLNATSIRLDHTVNRKLTIFGRYNHSPSEISQRGGAGTALSTLVLTKFKTQTLTVAATWMITAAANNDFRANFSKTRGAAVFSLDSFGGAVPAPDSLLFPFGNSPQESFFGFTLSGLTNAVVDEGKNLNNLQRQLNLVDNFSFSTGSHQIKFGVDYRKLFPIQNESKYGQTAIFSGVAGALTGKAASATVQAQASGPRVILFTNFSAYGQDTWRAKQRLTLTYGLRWDLNPPPWSKNGQTPIALASFDDPSTLHLAPFGTRLYKTTYNDLAPRVGAAYQLIKHPGREIVVRGGFGIFYDLGTGFAAVAFGPQIPFFATASFANVSYPLTATQAQPPVPNLNPPYGFLRAVDSQLKPPRTYQWNFAIEQALGSSRTLSASYVGAAGRHLLRVEQYLNPNSTFTNLLVSRNTATSDYDALQLQFQQRLSRGLQTVVSYTWSKSLDNASNDSSSPTPGGKIDPLTDRGPSDFDVRHSLRAAVSYNLPQPGRGFLGKALLRGWGIDTNISARSATPVNVSSTRNIGFGTTILRPDLVDGVPIYLADPTSPGGRKINKSAFVIPIPPTGQAGRQGTLGRNALRGLASWQVDLALRRQFDLTERLKLQVRAEGFNVFNHPNFADPTGSLTSALFGVSSSMLGAGLGSGGITGGFNPLYQIGGPRSMQFAAKLIF